MYPDAASNVCINKTFSEKSGFKVWVKRVKFFAVQFFTVQSPLLFVVMRHYLKTVDVDAHKNYYMQMIWL